jgi:16S rRNA (guanine527-N7)-methyltransferase
LNAGDHDTLAAALARHGFDFTPAQIAHLDNYCRLLWDFNTRLNLTRHTDYEKFVARDIVDVQQLSAELHAGEEVFDLGSGGGVPGIPLAILRPDLVVSLCESVAKKAKVLDEMVQRLALPAPVYAARAEDILDDFRFDAVVARAVGPLWKILYWLKDHWASVDRLLLIKGPRWTEERGEARHRGLLKNLELRVVKTYPMPGAGGESVILKLWHKGKPEPG